MFTSIIYKEWLKLRLYALLSTLVALAMPLYGVIRIHRAIALQGADHIWVVFVESMRYVPLILGLLCAIAQFAPELSRRSLKLTLHLPQSPLRSTYQMLACGVTLLLWHTLLYIGVLFIGLQGVLAYELLAYVLSATLPWILAGFLGYLLMSWILLEPTWRRRILYTLITVLLMRLCFISPTAGAYAPFLPTLLIYTILSSTLVWLSVSRFKEGRQD